MGGGGGGGGDRATTASPGARAAATGRRRRASAEAAARAAQGAGGGRRRRRRRRRGQVEPVWRREAAEARPEDIGEAPKEEEKRQEARQEPKGPKVDPFGGAKPVAIKELPSKAAEGDAPLEEKAAALEIKDE